MHRAASATLLFALLLPLTCSAADWDPSTGPVIEGRGPWSPVETTWRPPQGHRYELVFDIGTAGDDPAEGSRYIESAARFINMQVGSGVPPEDLHLAVVLHGAAGRYALSAEAYAERFGVPHPEVDMALSAMTVLTYLQDQGWAVIAY